LEVPSSPTITFSNHGFEEEPLTLGDLITWAVDTAKGMEYLASKSVLHMDLACRNILIAEDGSAKISDFGLAKNMYGSLNVYKKQTNAPLPLKWMAPESIGDLAFSTYSDIWSYGIVLWEMLSLGRSPYPGFEGGYRPQDSLLQRLMNGERMKCPEYSPPELYMIMLDCWRSEPTERISFQRIVLVLEEFSQVNGGQQLTVSPGAAQQNFEYLTMGVPSQMLSSPSSNPELETADDGYLMSVRSPAGNEPGDQIDQDGYLISLRATAADS
jgi:serine/threonine protein kinase